MRAEEYCGWICVGAMFLATMPTERSCCGGAKMEYCVEITVLKKKAPFPVDNLVNKI